MNDRKIPMDGLQAVGVVHAETIPKEELRFGQKACIEIFEEYACALDRFKEHTHFWVLCWLDRANRDVLQTYSWHLRGEGALPYGVFALRSPCRPNPVSLTLVRLLRREGNLLYVDGLDIFDKTPVLDIKPYAKGTSCFPEELANLPAPGAEFVRRMFHKKAVMHHREECAWLALAVPDGVAAEEYLGDITDDIPGVSVRVRGGGCFMNTVKKGTHQRPVREPAAFYLRRRRPLRLRMDEGRHVDNDGLEDGPRRPYPR